MIGNLSKDIAAAENLSDEDRKLVHDLVAVWNKRLARNRLRSAYYTMHKRPRELGVSVPPNLRNLEQVLGWPAKAVDTLAARSQFDGFSATDSNVDDFLQALTATTALKRKYRQLVKSELKHCCSFITVTAGVTKEGDPPVIISAYPATSAAALWDYRKSRIKAGLVVVDRDTNGRPVWVNVFTDTHVIRLKKFGTWSAEYLEHGMGRPLIEPLAYDATLERPFGRSRISRAVMNITDNAMRASLRGEVAAEFATSPQKFLLGADSELIQDMSKWDAFIGAIFAISKDSDGDIPQFGQLPQVSMQPHIDYMRALAARFSGETNVPLGELGVVTDNPSSAEAIYAAKEPLVIEAQNLNADNGDALREIALMALAIKEDTDYSYQRSRNLTIQPKFRSPAMPSVVSQADAMLKIVTAVNWFAGSDVLLEELGFSDDQILRLRSDRIRAAAYTDISQAALASGLDLS